MWCRLGSKVMATASRTTSTSTIQILDVVYFSSNGDVIQARSFKLLDNVATVLVAHAEVAKIIVEGHTDDQGDDAYNLDLSQRRAEAVVTYLVKKAVSRDRLEAKGYGETRPLVENTSKKRRATNRRVELKIAGSADETIVR